MEDTIDSSVDFLRLREEERRDAEGINVIAEEGELKEASLKGGRESVEDTRDRIHLSCRHRWLGDLPWGHSYRLCQVSAHFFR